LPLACVLTWVGVGYFNEPDELTGISHYIEHLFFKGTPKRGVGIIAQETKAIGGYLNASTIYDHTYYFTVVPSGSVNQALDIQSDALLNPLFDAEEMTREKEVVIEELKRKYDNPNPYAWEKLLEMAFERHRIRRWRMGREEEIRRFSRDAVVEYYNRYYRPANITLVVVGDVNQKSVMAEVERRYGMMPEGNVRHEVSPVEPVQKEPKMSRLLGDLSRVLVKMGFQSPPITHPDYYAMTFLSTLLGRGRSSRLYRSLREEKGIVDSIGSSLYASKDVGFFTMEAELKPEKIAVCEEELWVEMERLRRDPPSIEEVSKIRNIIEANFFSEREDVMGQAYGLAFFESLGGYPKAVEYVQKMRAVTPAEVVRVAEQYCAFSMMNLLEYVPKSVGQGAKVDDRLENLRKRVSGLVEKLGPVMKPASAPKAPELQLPQGVTEPIGRGIEAIPLDGGGTLLHLRTGALPLATIAVYFPGGRLDETVDNCGITQFVLRSTLKGTENRTADEIAFEMESLGSSIQVESTADLFGYSTNVLSRNLETAMDLLCDVMLRPTLPEAEIEKERTSALAKIQRIRDDMFRYPIELFYQSLFGLHPYGLPRQGTEASVRNFSRKQLWEWYSETFTWKKMVVAIVGDVERERAIELVRRRFSVTGDADLEPRAQLFPVVPNRGMREKVETRDRKQTGVVLGFNGVSLRDDRYFALEVLRNHLSGMGGSLFHELRERRALAYTVTAFNIGLMRGGAFFTYVGCSPEKEKDVRDLLMFELERTKRRAPTAEEVRTAKAYTRGSHAIGLQGNRAIAYAYLQQFITGRGLQAVTEYDRYIDAVTPERVRAAAADVFDLENCAIGIVRGEAA